MRLVPAALFVGLSTLVFAGCIPPAQTDSLHVGAGGAAGHVIEYAGSTISAMSMEARMTVCNMSIEAGGRAGMIAPDAPTFE